ncbi:MAG: metallophosphoesterase family protein [Longimicrobiales bacterium]
MKVVHLSDVHLGFGAHESARGRSADVIRAFETAMVRAAELEPELVLIAGDLFDHPSVTPPPIAAFSKAATDFHRRLPGVPIVIAAGSRDTPLDADSPGPLAVVGALDGVEVAVTRPRQISLGGGALNLAVVPHRAVIGARRLDLSPDPKAKWNVLVAYTGVARDAGHATPLDIRGWDYVALGSEHTYRKVADRVYYSGSLERVDPDPWLEAASEKGFIVTDLKSGDVSFWPTRARAVISLAPIEATGGGPATVSRRLAEALAGVPGGIEGKLVRIPIRGLSADDLAALDREVIEPVRRRAAEVRIEALPGQGASHGLDGSAKRSGVGSGTDEVTVSGMLDLARRLVDDRRDLTTSMTSESKASGS